MPNAPVAARMGTEDPRSLAADVARMYGAGDAASKSLRAAHLNAVLRLTPQTMAASCGSALCVVVAFSPAVPLGMWVWLAAMFFFCGLAVVAWQRQRRTVRAGASPRALHRATAHASVLAGLWGMATVLWFGNATPAQQMTLATLMTGMIGAGSFVLSPLPLASLAYVLILSVSSLCALWLSGNPALSGVALLLGLYAPMVSIGSLAAWRKDTALTRAKEQAADQERLLAVLLQDFEQQAGEALWEVGPDGQLRHQSPRLRELLAIPNDKGVDLSLLRLVRRHSVAGADSLQQAFDGGRPFRDLLLPWGPQDRLRHLSISGKPLIDKIGQTLGWRGVLADVSEKVHGEQLLRKLAHTDSLTGLANRFVLRDTLAQALRQSRQVALLSIDLDHFKTVNDSHGHSVGDELLKAVAGRLRACVRPGDLVARLGGDEFAMLVVEPQDSPESAALAARVVAALSEPFDIGTRRLRVGASVGVAVCDGADAGVDDMLGRADLALYAAKGAGRGQHLTYADELGDMSQRRLAIEEGLRQALRQGQLALHWQAKVEITSWQITGAEVLVRWTHPALGRIGPNEFIAVAEQCGLIDELGAWVLVQACQAAVGTLQDMTISVNVSPLQFHSGNFVGVVRQALRESGLPASQLELEITESVFIDDASAALDQLHALRALGVRVALDDFGTGYSSLSYLRRFPFDTLKIDRSFVNEVLLHKDARAIVQMIASLAATLGMRTVCEGVETAEQLAAVSDAGCDQVQGYLISEPLPLAGLCALQARWHERSPLKKVWEPTTAVETLAMH